MFTMLKLILLWYVFTWNWGQTNANIIDDEY